MEAIKTIGQILTETAERDCIHMAIFPAIAAEDVSRGHEVGLVYGTTDQIKNMDRFYGLPAIGIVDPFLKDWCVRKGQRCWVFLFPGSVTGMRHHWLLPAIDTPLNTAVISESENWLRRFDDKWNFDYDETI